MFGFLTSAKRGEVIIEAANRAGVELLVVGEAAPNIDASRFKTTGYVSDDDFDAYYAQVDRIVNLRYPSAGETSGTLIRAFEMGKPVAVSDYAQFAEFPDDCVVKIPLGDGEVDALADFFTRDFDYDAVARAQRAWLDANARLDQTVDGYLRALNGAPQSAGKGPASGAPASAGEGPASGAPASAGEGPASGAPASAGEVPASGAPASAGEVPAKAGAPVRTIPLFPSIEVVAQHDTELVLRNIGDFTIRTRVYGEPSYRLIAKLFDGANEIVDCWIEFPRDLAPGETTTIDIPYHAGATLRLYHAIEGIPMLEPEPWHAATL